LQVSNGGIGADQCGISSTLGNSSSIARLTNASESGSATAPANFTELDGPSAARRFGQGVAQTSGVDSSTKLGVGGF